MLKHRNWFSKYMYITIIASLSQVDNMIFFISSISSPILGRLPRRSFKFSHLDIFWFSLLGHTKSITKSRTIFRVIKVFMMVKKSVRPTNIIKFNLVRTFHRVKDFTMGPRFQFNGLYADCQFDHLDPAGLCLKRISL